MVGAARQDLDDETFRRHVADRLNEHAADVPARAHKAILHAARYCRFDLDEPATVAAAVGTGGGEPVGAYLALPPSLFSPALSALAQAELPAGSRIAVEKPFGEDLDSAVALNHQLSELAGDAGEAAVFRIDHVLGMATTHNLLGVRLANEALEPVWNGTHVEQIEVLWEETLGLEGRAGYYDRAGALKDVIQNHVLQILCLLAMEPPAGLGERALRDAKVDVLHSVRPLRPADIPARTRRARYMAGRVGERRVPAYADEEGVNPARGTETFAELVLELDSPRWEGTRFVLRAGKALSRRRKQAVLRFRPAGAAYFDGETFANELRIGVDGPHNIALDLASSTPGSPPQLVRLPLTGDPPPAALPAYANVLLEVLRGGSTLSVRSDEVEEAWRIVTPVLEAWASGRVPLEEYPAGSDGPPPRT